MQLFISLGIIKKLQVAFTSCIQKVAGFCSRVPNSVLKFYLSPHLLPECQFSIPNQNCFYLKHWDKAIIGQENKMKFIVLEGFSLYVKSRVIKYIHIQKGFKFSLLKLPYFKAEQIKKKNDYKCTHVYNLGSSQFSF